MTSNDLPSGTAPAPVSLRYFLDERGVLAGVHTVPSDADDLSPQLGLLLSSTEGALRLTASESHGLIQAWHALLTGQEGLPRDGLSLVLPTDSSRLEVTFHEPVAASTLAWVELADDVPVVVAGHRLTPTAARDAMVAPYSTAGVSLANALRGLASLPPLEAPEFTADQTYSVATPLVEAVLATVPAFDVRELAASHFIWSGIIEQGYRPDISFNTLETLAARSGRAGAFMAAFSAASDLAVEALGSNGPTPLLQGATSLVATATSTPHEHVVALSEVVAEHFFRHLQVVVASAVMYDAAAPEDIQPPLRAWLMALEGPGDEFDGSGAH